MNPPPRPRRPAAPRPELADARRAGYLNIGDAAAATGLSPKMIRHYEAIGLLPAARRSFAGYRLYGPPDLHRLRFIQRGRRLGFSMDEIRDLLGLWDDTRRSSSRVKQLALGHVADLERRIAGMEAMRRTLQTLVHRCHGDDRPDCPILDDLAAP